MCPSGRKCWETGLSAGSRLMRKSAASPGEAAVSRVRQVLCRGPPPSPSRGPRSRWSAAGWRKAAAGAPCWHPCRRAPRAPGHPACLPRVRPPARRTPAAASRVTASMPTCGPACPSWHAARGAPARLRPPPSVGRGRHPWQPAPPPLCLPALLRRAWRCRRAPRERSAVFLRTRSPRGAFPGRPPTPVGSSTPSSAARARQAEAAVPAITMRIAVLFLIVVICRV